MMRNLLPAILLSLASAPPLSAQGLTPPEPSDYARGVLERAPEIQPEYLEIRSASEAAEVPIHGAARGQPEAKRINPGLRGRLEGEKPREGERPEAETDPRADLRALWSAFQAGVKAINRTRGGLAGCQAWTEGTLPYMQAVDQESYDVVPVWRFRLLSFGTGPFRRIVRLPHHAVAIAPKAKGWSALKGTQTFILQHPGVEVFDAWPGSPKVTPGKMRRSSWKAWSKTSSHRGLAGVGGPWNTYEIEDLGQTYFPGLPDSTWQFPRRR